MATQYKILVIETATDEVVRELGPMPEWKADRVERGLLMQMDTDRFHVDQVEVSGDDE